MRLSSKIYVSYGLLVMIAISGAFLSYKSSKQAAFFLERSDLAHTQYQDYLALSDHASQIFKQFNDIIMLDETNGEFELNALKHSLRADLNKIRQVVGKEIQLVGEEEIEELDDIAAVEEHLSKVMSQYQQVLENKNAGADIISLALQLRQVAETKQKRTLNELVNTVIAGEHEEVKETRALAQQQARFLQLAAILFALLAISSAFISLRIIMNNIRNPLMHLQKGVNKIVEGELSYRIAEEGPLELRKLAKTFNKMSEELMDRDQVIRIANKELEQKVADRTAELKRLLDKLQVDEKNRRRLIADVSHELRTPLTIIRGEADIALRGETKSAETYKEALSKVKSAAIHTARIVDDLLFVARKESGEVRLKVEEIDLIKMLPEFVYTAHNFNQFSTSTIIFSSTLKNAYVQIDSVRIKQVVLILLENAVHYGGGEIIVSIESCIHGYQLSVKDQGPGMSESEISQAFERFFRGNNATDRYDGGAGLGLPVARAIVEAHSGTISINSEPGMGTVVAFTLPAKNQLRIVS